MRLSVSEAAPGSNRGTALCRRKNGVLGRRCGPERAGHSTYGVGTVRADSRGAAAHPRGMELDSMSTSLPLRPVPLSS
jgi:hypothetical protein